MTASPGATSTAVSAGPTYEEVAVGDALPTLVLPITRTLVVSGAIASRDYQDVHHDQVLAQSRGSKDIFMNILTTNGLVGRYITDWSGPRSRLAEIRIRLGAPNHPDGTMTLTGSVTEKGPVDDDGATGKVTVSLRGANALGDHVTGTVVVVLPLGSVSESTRTRTRTGKSTNKGADKGKGKAGKAAKAKKKGKGKS